MKISLKKQLSNIRSFKGRKAVEGQKVKVYKNLHNGLWSIKDYATGLVLGHVEEVRLTNATFYVSEKGRQRVIKEQSKNVHAFVIGHLTEIQFYDLDVEVTYNPYKYDSFVTRNGNQPVNEAACVSMVASKSQVLIGGTK